MKSLLGDSTLAEAPTLREKLDAMLEDIGVTPEQKGAIIAKVIGLSRPGGGEIVHQIGPNGFHRLIIGDQKSEWSPQTDIIRHGDFIAATDAYINLLPQVGRVYALRNKDFRTESVQTLID